MSVRPEMLPCLCLATPSYDSYDIQSIAGGCCLNMHNMGNLWFVNLGIFPLQTMAHTSHKFPHACSNAPSPPAWEGRTLLV